MEAPIAEIKPNIKKAFISNIISVAVIIALIIGSFVYLNILVGLDIFIDTFKQLGISISSSSLIFWSIFLVLFFTALLLILNYINLGKITYTLYPDKLLYGKTFFIMHLSGKMIPYANISRVTYDNKSFLNTSKVTLELTGMKEHKIELDFIDNAQEVVEKIHGLIRNYRADYYAGYSRNYGIYQKI